MSRKNTEVITYLEIVEDQRRAAFKISRIFPATNLSADIGSMLQRTILNVRCPEVSCIYWWNPDIITVKQYQFRNRNRPEVDIRALVPVQRDPLEIKVDGRPQNVCRPGAIILFGFSEPVGILQKSRSAQGRRICVVE